jgi:hypothetical protein
MISQQSKIRDLVLLLLVITGLNIIFAFIYLGTIYRYTLDNNIILKELQNTNDNNVIHNENEIEIDTINISFEEQLYTYINDIGILHADIVYTQALIETGYFTSRVFTDLNNLFGMRTVYKRPTTQIGSDNGYGIYNNWKESVIDYALYQLYCAKDLNKEDYLNHLDNNYAEANNYVLTIKQLLK